MKYQVGSFVKVLVARDCALEGNVGVIDAVHEKEQTYTVGFYAAEDCMMGSARFYEEELAPYKQSKAKEKYEVGDIVESLVDKPTKEKGNEGEVIAVYPETKAIAVSFQKEKEFPIILPYGYDEVRLILKKEFRR